jgi:glyceraldehyde 3-phosphate dehydrogenase
MSFTEEPKVSNDIIGDPHSSMVDALSTMVLKIKIRSSKSYLGMTMNGVLLVG